MDIYHPSTLSQQPHQHQNQHLHDDPAGINNNSAMLSSHDPAYSMNDATFSPSFFSNLDENDSSELGLMGNQHPFARARTSSIRNLDPSLRGDDDSISSPYTSFPPSAHLTDETYASYLHQAEDSPQTAGAANSPFFLQVHLDDEQPSNPTPKTRIVSGSSLSSSTSSSASHSSSAQDPSNLDPSCFPTATDFASMTSVYLSNLAPKKRLKALIDQEMYDKVLTVLMNPTVTVGTTAQFRFWAKKMFKLVEFNGEFVATHEGRPVAVKEQIYDVLVYCHGQSGHGGRDKTMSMVRNFYSWVPKELVAQFVKGCPICDVKRDANPNFFGSHNCPPIGNRRKSSIVPLPSVENQHEDLPGADDDDYIDPSYVSPAASTTAVHPPPSSRTKRPDPKTASLSAAKAAAAVGSHSIDTYNSPTTSHEIHTTSSSHHQVITTTEVEIVSAAAPEKKARKPKKAPAKARKVAPARDGTKVPAKGRPGLKTKAWAVQMAVEEEEEEEERFEQFDRERQEGGVEWEPRYDSRGYLDYSPGMNGGEHEYFDGRPAYRHSPDPYNRAFSRPGPAFDYQRHPSHELERGSSRSTIDSPLIGTPYFDPQGMPVHPHLAHVHPDDVYNHRLSIPDVHQAHPYHTARTGAQVHPSSHSLPNAYEQQQAAAAAMMNRRASTGQLLGIGGPADFHRRSSQGRARTRQEQRMMEENEARSRREPIHEEDDGREDDFDGYHGRYGQIIEGRGSIGGEHIAPGNSLLLEPSSYAYEGGQLSPSQPYFDLSPHSVYPPPPPPQHDSRDYQLSSNGYAQHSFQQPQGGYFGHHPQQQQPYLAPPHTEYDYSPHGSVVPLPGQHSLSPAHAWSRPTRPTPLRRSSSHLQHQLNLSDIPLISSHLNNGRSSNASSRLTTAPNSPLPSTNNPSLLDDASFQYRRSPLSSHPDAGLIHPSLLMQRRGSTFASGEGSNSSSGQTIVGLPVERRESYLGLTEGELFEGLMPRVEGLMEGHEEEEEQVGFEHEDEHGELDFGMDQQEQHHQHHEELEFCQ